MSLFCHVATFTDALMLLYFKHDVFYVKTLFQASNRKPVTKTRGNQQCNNTNLWEILDNINPISVLKRKKTYQIKFSVPRHKEPFRQVWLFKIYLIVFLTSLLQSNISIFILTINFKSIKSVFLGVKFMSMSVHVATKHISTERERIMRYKFHCEASTSGR